MIRKKYLILMLVLLIFVSAAGIFFGNHYASASIIDIIRGGSANFSRDVGDFPTSDDPILIVTKVIRYLLELLGIVFLLILLYAGFTWMLAGGDEKKVEKAKKLIKNGVIGVFVIVLSLVIVQFVLKILESAVL